LKKHKLIKEVHFSKHAFIRAQERITLDAEEVLQIIKLEKYVYIGSEKNNNRDHRLFYSDKDSQCFVIIQDIKTNTIITILPLDYHEHISWAVSLVFQKEAKELILGKTVPESSTSDNHRNKGAVNQYFHVCCDTFDEYLNYSSRIKLCKFDASSYDHKIEKMLTSEVAIKDILKRIDLVTSENKCYVNEIMIKRTSSDVTPLFVELSLLGAA
jgi:hypothetical protein